MCFPSAKLQDRQSMSEKHQVPVFDPESCDLRRLPLNRIDVSDFERIEVSRWRRRFDIYASNDARNVASQGHSEAYAIITHSSDDTQGKSFLARLYYSRLGLAADVQRVLSSKYRTLYIGPIPG